MASIEVWENPIYASDRVSLLGFLIVYQEKLNRPYYLFPDGEADYIEILGLVSKYNQPKTIYRVVNDNSYKYKIQTPTISPLQIIDQNFDIQIVNSNSLIVDRLRNSRVLGQKATVNQKHRW